MNTSESKRINARIVNVDMKTAYNIYINKYADKYMFMKAGECLTNKDDFVRTAKSFKTFAKYLFKRG